MEQILTTKLYIPAIRHAFVPRQRLLERLNGSIRSGCKLILISAPAGFGKTTLVCEWVEQLSLGAFNEDQRENKIAWLSLDEGDNDPKRFFSYLVASLNRAKDNLAALGEGTLSMLQSPQTPPIEAVLTSLINEIAVIPNKILLFLDDYHLVIAQPVHDALSFLLDNLPQNMHLVIATREDPPLPLSRLRARGQMTELRAADLRFTSSEASDFLNQVMGLRLAAEDVARLETRTEGWIAGLHLAAISLQGKEKTAQLIKSFSGSHRFILDYLIDEVLLQQPESVQTFMLQTAILDSLCGSLCDALTNQDHSQQTLEMLEHANLFVIPLDNERRWYRYHHLFADLLRQRLRQTVPEQVTMLHIRASKWHEQNGSVDMAIEHALRAEEFDRSARLLEDQVDELWQNGEHGNLRRWLEAMPVELVSSRPQLSILHAYYLLSSGQINPGEDLLQKTEKKLEPDGKRGKESTVLSEAERIKLLGRVVVVRALIDSFTGDVPGTIQHASTALEHLPEKDLTWRSLAAFALGDAHSFLGDMAASYQARSEAVRACEAAGDVYYIMVANLKLASTLREQGELYRTLEVCQRQEQHAKKFGFQKSSPFGCLLTLWGEVLAELNDLENALEKAQEGVELAQFGGNLVIIAFSYLYLLRVLFSRGDLSYAAEIIQKVTQLDRDADVPAWLIDQMANWQVRIWLVQHEMDAVSHWVEIRGLNFDKNSETLPEMDFSLLFEYIVYARVLMAQNRLDQANALLQQLLIAAESGGRMTRAVEILLLQAMSFQSQDNIDGAVAVMERALTIAEQGGFIRIFVDEGPSMARLLYEVLTRGIATDYARRLLAAFPAPDQRQMAHSKPQAPASALFESLSEREIEILHLIAEGLTNPEIAARLFLSVHTVKTHIRNIYAKLDAHNRVEAVTRARVLGLLSPA